jgi:hypothetical protein
MMDAKFTGKTPSKDQSIEQALRRLKYLHTSLMPQEESTRQNGHKLDDRILLTKELKSRYCSIIVDLPTVRTTLGITSCSPDSNFKTLIPYETS